MSIYKPRRAPVRFMEGAPLAVIDCIDNGPQWSNDRYDIIFDTSQASAIHYLNGISCTASGGWYTFELHALDMRELRERNRRKRIAWRELPEAVRKSVNHWLAMGSE